MQIFDCPQGSDDWFAARLGVPTASRFSDVIAKKGPRGGIPKGRQTYLYKLAGEILSGQPMDSYSNHHMERGSENESEARDLYCLLSGNDVEQVGFIKNGNCGASPDGLVGGDGLVEIKDCLAHIQIARLLDGGLPPEHKAQVQGQMMVCERSWCDFVSHSKGIKPLVVRVERDEQYIAELRDGVDLFVDELNELVEKIRGL